MIPAKILPDLTADDLTVLADLVKYLPVHVVPTYVLWEQLGDLSIFLYKLADLRRQT